MSLKVTLALLLAGSFCINEIACETPKEDDCENHKSCSSCLTTSYCTWCVTKSRCTKQACGNDNVIYPKHIFAFMSGSEFCPKVVESNQPTFKSGKKDVVVVKITQIYLYMAFTPWKCNFNVNGKEMSVSAVLIADDVYCEAVELKNESEQPYVDGKVTVLWDFNKEFDGALEFKVCRCDLDPKCTAC